MTTAGPGLDDREHFAHVYHEHFNAVLAYALARADIESAKDAVAETFLVAWRRRAEVPNPELAWLLGVTCRTLAGQWRSQTRQRLLRRRISEIGRPYKPTGGPEDEVSERAVVLDALNRLRIGDRELLCLVAWDGLDHGAAASVLGCSRRSVAVRLHRARRRFEEALAQTSSEPVTTSRWYSQMPSALAAEPGREEQ